MKKLFQSKLKKCILIVLTFFILFNAMMPTYSHATDFVGDMLEPVADFVCSIGDMVIDLLQGMMVPGAPKAVTTREGFGDQQAVPIIMYSPLAIFANKIPALDIDFLNPASNFENQYKVLITLSETFTSGEREDCIKFLTERWGVDETTAETDWNLVEMIRQINSITDPQERQTSILELLKGTAIMSYDIINLVDDEGNDLYSTDEERIKEEKEVASALGLSYDTIGEQEAQELLTVIYSIKSKARITDNITLSQLAAAVKKEIERNNGMSSHEKVDMTAAAIKKYFDEDNNDTDRDGMNDRAANVANYVKQLYGDSEENFSNIDDIVGKDYQKNAWKTAGTYISQSEIINAAKAVQAEIPEAASATPEQIIYYYVLSQQRQNRMGTVSAYAIKNAKEEISREMRMEFDGVKYAGEILSKEDVGKILKYYNVTSANPEASSYIQSSSSTGSGGTSGGTSGSGGSSSSSASASTITKATKEVDNAGNPAANTAVIIGPIISKWYIALRNLAIVGLLIVLVYIGIRILLSSASEQTAKYQQMLMNWVMALVIVFFIHYIMLGLITFNNAIINLLAKDSYKEISTTIVTNQYEQTLKDNKLMNKANSDDQIANAEDLLNLGDTLMNTVRWNETKARNDEESAQSDSLLTTFGYATMYVALVIYTLIFTFRYLKRVIYIAFLTVIAPMVSLTYPIDKVGDGKAQAFGTWFKEYLFNLLIQPVHLLLYVVLVSSALDFAQANPLYGIIAIGFILEAEKFIKEMFGIQGENGALGAFASGALFAQGMGLLQRGVNKIAPKGKEKEESDNSIWQKKTDNDDEASSSTDPTGLRTAFGAGDSESEGETENQGATGALGTAGETEGTEGTEGTENEQTGEGGAPNVRLDAGEAAQPEGEGAIDEETAATAAVVGGATAAAALSEPTVSENATQQLPTQNQERRNALSDNTTQPRTVSTPQTQRERRPIRKPTARGARAKYRGKKIALGAIKNATRIAGGGALGLAGATIGVGAGLASGDGIEGVMKGIAAGATTGIAAGVGLANLSQVAAGKVTGAVRTARTDYLQGRDPDRLKEKENKKKAEAFMRDQYKSYKKLYGRAEANRKLEQRVQLAQAGLDYRALENDRYGKKGMQLMDRGLTASQSVAIIRTANEDISRQDLANPQSAVYQAFEKRIGDLPERDRIIEYIDQVHGIEGEDHARLDQLRQQAREQKEAETQQQETQRRQEQQERIRENHRRTAQRARQQRTQNRPTAQQPRIQNRRANADQGSSNGQDNN